MIGTSHKKTFLVWLFCLASLVLGGTNIYLLFLIKGYKKKLHYYAKSLEHFKGLLSNKEKDVLKLKIQLEVQQIRGLKFVVPVKFISVGKEELDKIIVEHINAELKENKINREDFLKILLKFGFVNEEINLFEYLRGLYKEQVQGMYDENKKVMLLVEGTPLTGPMREMFLAHELTHALQDQHFNLKGFLKKNNTDRKLACQAVVEGDAVVVMFKYYLKHLKVKKVFWDIFRYLSIDQSHLYNAPRYVQQTLLFPYVWGSKFVSYIQNKKGWGGVNQLYAKWPLSTEQILHPEKYPQEQPIKVSVDESIAFPEKWQILDSDVMGEFYIYVLLSTYLSEPEAKMASAGWGGDRWIIWKNKDGGLYLRWKSVWDSTQDAREFVNAMRLVLERRGIKAKIVRKGKEVMIEY